MTEPRGNTYRLGATPEEFSDGLQGYGGLIVQSEEELDLIRSNNNVKRKKNKKF